MANVEFTMDWRGPQAIARAKQGGMSGLMKAAEYVRGQSVQRAPIDEGTLRASAAVKPVGETAVQVGFHTPYAEKQHEELGYRHPKGGQAKYLESVVVEEKNTILRLIGNQIKGALS